MDKGPPRLAAFIRDRGHAAAIGVITAAGLTLRVTYLLAYSRHQPFGGDAAYFYYWGAVQFARGYGFLSSSTLLYNYPTPGAHHPPGFIVLLGGLYKIGLHSPTALRLAMCVLGSMTIVVAGALLTKVVSKRAGIIGAIIFATYPGLWLTDTQLMSETLAIFAFTVALYFVYSYHRSPSIDKLLGASVGLTIASLTRAEMVVLFPVVLIPLALARRSIPWTRRVVQLAAAAVFPIVCFGAWYAYNLNHYEKPVYLSTGFGPTALAGACDEVFSGPLIGSISIPCADVVYRRSNPADPAYLAEHSPATIARTRAFARYFAKHGDLPPATWDTSIGMSTKYEDASVDNAKAMKLWEHYTSTHRSQLPKVVAARELRLLGLWNPAQQHRIDSVYGGDPIWMTRLTPRYFWLLAIASIAGGLLWRRRRIPLYPLLAQVALAFVVTALTFGLIRYRSVMDVCVALLAATAIDWVAGRLTGRRRSTLAEDTREGDPDLTMPDLATTSSAATPHTSA